MENIIRKEDPDIIMIIGSFYFPWFLLNAALRTQKVFIIRYGGIIEMEEDKKIWLRLGKDFVNTDYNYIFPSKHSKQTVEEIHNINLPHSWVIHNGIPKEFFKKRIKKKNRAKKFKIGFVGRHYAVKNPEFCLKLAGKLGGGNNCEIAMVTGNLSLKKGLAKTYKKAGIKLKPTLSTPKLAKFYQDRDLIISPSHFETYGYVPLEAIASGTPALINNTLGIKEVFARLGLKDFIVDFNDIKSIVKKINHIKESDLFIDDITSWRIRREYCFSNTMCQFFDAFEEILGRYN